MQRLGLWLVTACLIAAGCIGAVAQGTPAMEHRTTADEQAYATSENAELVGVHGAEANATWNDRDDMQEWTGNVSIHSDRIGDGAAALWVYEYRTSNATIEVLVNEEGEVVRTDRDDDVDEDAQAVEDWEVSSIEAVEIVQDHDDNWTIDDDGMAFYNLEHEDEAGDPVWSMVEFHDETGVIWARVNAATGAFLDAGTFTSDFGSGWSGVGSWGDGAEDGGSEEPYQEGGSFSDSVSAADDTNEHTFELDHDHPELAARLALEEPATGTVQATITGPEGSEVGTLEAGPDDPEAADAFSQVMDGEHTVTVELTDGLDQSYTLDWCADGQETGDEDAEAACERVEEANEDARRLTPGPTGD